MEEYGEVEMRRDRRGLTSVKLVEEEEEVKRDVTFSNRD